MRWYASDDPLPKGRQANLVAFKVVGIVIALYGLAFVWTFDVFAVPVRNSTYGWLGPWIRGDTNTVDIGKVGNYESSDVSKYQVFYPLCKIWLLLNGLERNVNDP